MKFNLKANVEVIARLSSQDVLLVGLAAVYPTEIEFKHFSLARIRLLAFLMLLQFAVCLGLF